MELQSQMISEGDRTSRSAAIQSSDQLESVRDARDSQNDPEMIKQVGSSNSIVSKGEENQRETLNSSAQITPEQNNKVPQSKKELDQAKDEHRGTEEAEDAHQSSEQVKNEPQSAGEMVEGGGS